MKNLEINKYIVCFYMVGLWSIFSSLLIYIFYKEYYHFYNQNTLLLKWIMIKGNSQMILNHVKEGRTFLRGFLGGSLVDEPSIVNNARKGKNYNMGIH